MNTTQFKKQYKKYSSKQSSKKRSIPPLEKHSSHDIEIRPSDKLEGQSYYWCKKCNVWVAWLSKQDTENARAMGLL